MAEEEKKTEGEHRNFELPELQLSRLLYDAGSSAVADLRKTVTALNLRIEGIKRRIELYETVLAESEFYLRKPTASKLNKIKASVKGLKIVQRNYMELKERIYQSMDGVLHDHDSEYRKLFRAFFIDGLSMPEIAKQAGTNKVTVQTRIYEMYCDFYDNDGISPNWRQFNVDRRKMQERAKWARTWKASHSRSTGK